MLCAAGRACRRVWLCMLALRFAPHGVRRFSAREQIVHEQHLVTRVVKGYGSTPVRVYEQVGLPGGGVKHSYH